MHITDTCCWNVIPCTTTDAKVSIEVAHYIIGKSGLKDQFYCTVLILFYSLIG